MSVASVTNVTDETVGLGSSVVGSQAEITEIEDKLDASKKLLDEDDRTTYTLEGRKFRVSKRYKPMKTIGTGAYGIVVSALDRWTGEKVAIKKVENAFDDLVDAKRVLREIKLLQHFEHMNVLSLKDILLPSSLSNFNDIYIISELMETDLQRVIYSKQTLTTEHIRYFCYQILSALRYIHSAGVFHRDVKPQNLLVNADCKIKLCDFGLAKSFDVDNLTDYVVTRWYRAPEILLASTVYGPEVDVWSVGCILAELYLRRPVFAGRDYIDMVRIICTVLGKPCKEDMNFIPSRRGRTFVEGLQYAGTEQFRLEKQLEKCDICPDALDLLKKMLQFNPEKRISVAEALEHPFIAELLYDDDYINCKKFNFQQEEINLTKPMLQELVFKEIARYNTEAREVMLAANEMDQLFFPLEKGEL